MAEHADVVQQPPLTITMTPSEAKMFRTTLALAIALAACKKPDSRAELAGSATPTNRGDADAVQPPSITSAGSADVDLLKQSTYSTTAHVTADRAFDRRFAVWAPSLVTVTVTQTGGSLGPFTKSIFDVTSRRLQMGSDSMTCAEPGCSMKSEIDVAVGTEVVLVRVESQAPIDMTIDVIAARKD